MHKKKQTHHSESIGASNETRKQCNSESPGPRSTDSPRSSCTCTHRSIRRGRARRRRSVALGVLAHRRRLPSERRSAWEAGGLLLLPPRRPLVSRRRGAARASAPRHGGASRSRSLPRRPAGRGRVGNHRRAPGAGPPEPRRGTRRRMIERQQRERSDQRGVAGLPD